MSEKLYSFIVKESKNKELVDSLLPQIITDWECFVIGDTNEYINQIADKDSRFHIIKESDKIKDINSAIKQASGQYVIILNSNDYFLPNALGFIQQMVLPTMADVIVYSTAYAETIPDDLDANFKCVYRYWVKKSEIMKNMFDSLSEFCFKREYIQKIGFYAPEEVFIFNVLANINAITKTGLICVLQQTRNLEIPAIEYKDLIDNFVKNKSSFTNNFWKDYFANIIPRLVSACIYQYDNQSIKYCAKYVPLKYIPCAYKPRFILNKIIHR